MEQLFMLLFTRQDWIKAQFREQEESFNETCESHIIAACGPRGWLPDVLGSKEPGREELISGTLVPSSRNNTPSAKQTFLDSLPTVRANDGFQSHTHFTDTGNEQHNLLDTLQTDSAVDPPVITSRSRSRQRDLETRQGKNAKQTFLDSSHNNTPSAKQTFLDSLPTVRGNDGFQSHTHFTNTGNEQGNLLDTLQTDSSVDPPVITSRSMSRQRDLETKQGKNAQRTFLDSSHNNAPSAKQTFLDSLPTVRGNDGFQSHTIMDTGNEQGNLLGTLQTDSSVDPPVITSRSRSSRRDLEIRQGQNANHLEDGNFAHGCTGRVTCSGSASLMHDSVMESVQLIGGVTQFIDRLSDTSEISVCATDGIAASALLQTSKSGASDCIPDSKSLSHGHDERYANVSQLSDDTSLAQPKQFLFDGIDCSSNKDSTTLEHVQINSDFPTFEASTTLEYVPADFMKGHAFPVSSMVEEKILNEIQKASSLQMTDMLLYDGEEGQGPSALSAETPDAVLLQNKAFFEDKEATIAASAVPRDIIVLPSVAGEVASGRRAKSINRHLANFSTEPCNTHQNPKSPSSLYINAQLERENALVTGLTTSDTRKAPVSHENSISPEAQDGKDNVAHIRDLSEDDLQQVLISRSTETQNASADARYNLRSSLRLVQDSTLTSTEVNVAEHWRRSKGRSDHAYEFTWPKMRRMKGRSTNVLATSPRLRCKEHKYARRESNRIYNRRSGVPHEAIDDVQPSPIATSLAIGSSTTGIEEHSLDQHERNFARVSDLSDVDDDDQQVLTPRSTETQNACVDIRYNLRSSIRLVQDPILKSAKVNAAECWRRSKGRSNHAYDFTWPIRRRMKGRSTNVFATFPRLRSKVHRYARRKSGRTYNRRLEFPHEVINELQPSPIPSSLVIGVSTTEIEAHSPEQHGRNVACISNLSEEDDDQQVLVSSSTETQNASADDRYNLSSSIRCAQDSSLKSAEGDADDFWVRSKGRSNHEYEFTWTKRRRMEGRSTNVFVTSPSLRCKERRYTHRESDRTYSCRSGISHEAINEFQLSPVANSLVISASTSEIEGHTLERHGGNVIPTMKVDSCSNREDMELLMPLSNENLHNNPTIVQAYDESKNCQSSTSSDHFNLDFHHQEEDRHDLLIAGTSYESERHIENNDGLEKIIPDPCGDVLRHASFPSLQHGDGLLRHDDIMPELEGFSIGLSSVLDGGDLLKDTAILSNSDIHNVTNERASLLEQLYISCSNISPVSRLSTKYKIHDVADVYQSLPIGLLEQIQLGNYFHAEGEMEHKFGEEEKLTGSDGKLQLAFDDLSSQRQHSPSLDCLNFRSICEAKKPLLSPRVGKVTHRTFIEQHANSEKLNPELVCFRIDENSPITDENNHLEGYMEKSKVDGRLLQMKTTDRKPSIDISLYQDVPTLSAAVEEFQDRNSLNSVCTEVCSNMQLEDDYASSEAKNGNKENATYSYSARGNMKRKATDSISSGCSKLKISVTSKQKKRSRIAFGACVKPKNIITSVSSFIPRVQQNQQPSLSFAGKRYIKVKALEAAEVQKRLDEKRQNEREIRKVAAKIEREKIEHENAKQLEFRRKHEEEERKRKEVNLAARKRQREEEKKEKEGKRKCNEEARKLQRNQVERQHAKEVKELQDKAADEKDRGSKCSAGEAKQLITPEKGTDLVGCKKLTAGETDVGRPAMSSPKEHNHHKKINDDEKAMVSAAMMHNGIQDRVSVNDGGQGINSYEISPYKGSDDEDGEDDDMHRNKYIPPWARTKGLYDILLSVENFVPEEIFSWKSSFNVAEVLLPRIRRRPL